MNMYYRVLIILFGLVIGSFSNVLIYRIPRGEEWVKTPSHCTGCGHRLAWYDLIPVFSWMFLGGKCRYCGGRVSARYPAVELLNALLWLICFEVFGFSPFLPASLAVSTVLMVLALIDMDTREMPDGFQVFLLIAGVVWNLYGLISGKEIWLDNLIGFFAVSVPLFLIAVLTNGGMGGGDIKLTAVCGLLLGWKRILLSLALGAVSGTAVMLPIFLIKKKGRKETLPFGPFLAFGILLSMWFGDSLIAWYLRVFMGL